MAASSTAMEEADRKLLKFCDKHMPIIINRCSGTTKALSLCVQNLLPSSSSLHIRIEKVVLKWLLDNNHLVYISDECWYERKGNHAITKSK